MMNTNIIVSLNVLNYNTYEKTKKCIDSCLRQKHEKFRVLLIDNMSTDGSYEKLKETFGNAISYLQTGFNYGYAKGNNIGVKYCIEAGIPFSLILNSDTELVGEKIVANMVSVMKTHKDCAVVAPFIFDVTKNGLELNSNDSFYHKILRLFRVLPQNKSLSDNLALICEAQGSALLVDNKVFLTVGGFPEHYFMYCEECTLAKKILWNKLRIYWYKNDEEYILHYHDRTNGIEPWRQFLKGRNIGIEYFENRKVNPMWSIVFYIFILRLKLSSNIHMIKGMTEAKRLYKNGLSKEDIYKAALEVKNNYIG